MTSKEIPDNLADKLLDYIEKNDLGQFITGDQTVDAIVEMHYQMESDFCVRNEDKEGYDYAFALPFRVEKIGTEDEDFIIVLTKAKFVDGENFMIVIDSDGKKYFNDIEEFVTELVRLTKEAKRIKDLFYSR